MSCAQDCRCPYCRAKRKRTAVHVLGDYCAMGTRLAGDVTKVVEPKNAIEPDPLSRWRWRSNLCETCKLRGGVLLFNRAIAELRAFENGEEPESVTSERAERLAAYEQAERVKAEEKAEREREVLERREAKEKRKHAAETRRAARLGEQARKTARRAARSVANDTRAAGAP